MKKVIYSAVCLSLASLLFLSTMSITAQASESSGNALIVNPQGINEKGETND